MKEKINAMLQITALNEQRLAIEDCVEVIEQDVEATRKHNTAEPCEPKFTMTYSRRAMYEATGTTHTIPLKNIKPSKWVSILRDEYARITDEMLAVAEGSGIEL